MGSGVSTYEDRQKNAFLAEERKKKRAIRKEQNRVRQAENDAKKSERDAWLKSYRQRSGEESWWGVAWLTRPIQWWQEKKAWKIEEAKRAVEQNPDHELRGLTSAGSVDPVREHGAQSSAMASGGPVAESGHLRKRGRKSGD